MTDKKTSQSIINVDSKNWFVALIIIVGYLLFSLAYYGLLGAGVILAIAAFFNDGKLVIFLSVGISFIVVAFLMNTVVTRLATKKWGIHWPNVWPFGMY